MVRRGVLVGTAAALVLGAAFVAAALVSRPHHPAPQLATADSRMKITLVTPKEPAAPKIGPKLETTPPGAPDAPAATRLPPPPPAAAVEPREREPERLPDDFQDERDYRSERDFQNEQDRDFADRYPAEPYREPRERWRERRYDEDGQDDERYEPARPLEPPFWWRR